MKKILIAGIFPLEGSGSGQYALDLAYWLHKQGYEVSLAVTSNSKVMLHKHIADGYPGDEKFGELNITEIPFPHGHMRDFPGFTGHNLQMYNFTFAKMTDVDLKLYQTYIGTSMQAAIVKHEPDLIISNHVTPLSGILSDVLDQLKLDTPVIQIAHGTSLRIKNDKIKGKTARDSFASQKVFDAVFTDLLEKGKKLVKKTIAISDYAVDGLKSIGFSKEEIYKRYNGFDPEVFRIIKEEIDTYDLVKRTEHDLFQDKNDELLTFCCAEYRKNFGMDYLGGLHNLFTIPNVFVFAGKFTMAPDGTCYKGIDRLIEATVEMRKTRTDFGVVVCGSGKAYHKLIRMAYESGLDNMFFLGYQDNVTVLPYWNNLAVAGIYPSRREPLGVVALECAACGTPAITSNEGGFKVVSKNIGGEVVTDYPNGLAEAMGRAIDEDWKGQREKDFKKVAKFSWAKIAQEIDQKVIQELI